MEEHVDFTIGDLSFDVTSLHGEEAISRWFSYELACRAHTGCPRAGALLGADACIVVRDPFGGTRVVHGIVAEAERKSFDDGSVVLLVTVRPRAFVMTLSSDCRAFQDASVIDVVRSVLERSSIEARFSIVEPHEKSEFRAQYREDDGSYVCRLLEREGVHFWFDHQEDHSVMVISDRSASAPPIEHGASLRVEANSSLRSVSDVVEEVGTSIRASFTRATVWSFDAERPRLELEASAGGGHFERYEARGAGPKTPDAVKARARVLDEEAGVDRALIEGIVSGVRLVPGRSIEIVGDPEGRHDGRFLVVESTIDVAQRGRATDGDSSERRLRCRFRALPLDTPYRPAHRTPPSHQPGLQSGVVVGAASAEVHPDPAGRVRVQLHWDREGARDARSGRFMRVAQRGTADSMLLPRVGWNVLTLNEEGSPDVPHVLSRIHDAEHPPAYALPDNKTRVVFKTATTPGGGSFNEVRYEDRKGSEEMFLNASRDMGVLVKNIKNEVIDHDSQRAVAVDHALSISKDHVEIVHHDQRVTVGKNEKLSAIADRTVSVGNDLHQKVGAARKLHVGAAHGIEVAQTRSLKVGAALLDITLGPISASSGTTTSTTVGGAMVRATVKTLSEQVKLGTIQTIGGAKIEVAKDSHVITTKLMHAETVGGLMLLKSADTLGEAADALSMTIGAALAVKAPKMTIKGDKQIVLKCGASSITITEDTIALEATNVVLDGAVLDAGSARISHG